MRVQVVFQGGGAKVAALLAVGHVVQELAAGNRIELTRVAGTSAGAIVAALLASGADFDQVREDLMAVGDAGFRRMFPRRWFSTYVTRAARGKPFYDMSHLRAILEKDDYGLKGKTIGDFQAPDLQVTVADVTVGRKVVAGTANVVDTILDSCALPFVFRTAGALKDNPHLDGGLCENLPADRLLAERVSHGEVIAVSFEEPTARPRPTNPLSFAACLLELAIDNAVRRAARDVGEQSVHRIKTKLTTFSFDSVCADGLSDDPCNRVRLEARAWFDAWLVSRATSARRAYSGMPTDELMRRVDVVYRSLESDVEFVSSALVVTANCVGGHKDGDGAPLPDDVEYITRVRPLDVPLRCLKQSLGSSTGAVTRESEWIVEAFDGSQITDFVAVPSRDSEIDPHFQSLVLFFSNPLPPGQTYTVRRREAIDGAMRALTEGKQDYLGNKNTRANATFGAMFLILQVPNSHRVSHASYDDSEVPGQILTPGEISKAVPGLPTLGFSAYGWRADNVAPQKWFRAWATVAKA
mgnify:CR=1 FL=1